MSLNFNRAPHATGRGNHHRHSSSSKLVSIPQARPMAVILAELADRMEARSFPRDAALKPADGILSRCDLTTGKKGNRNGAFVIFSHTSGHISAGIQNWTDGLGWESYNSWSSDPAARRAEGVDRLLMAEQSAQARARRAETAARHREARETARDCIEATSPADPAHRYLANKGVQAHGIRQLGDRLVIPVRDRQGTLHGVQTIGLDGFKLFNLGCAKAGNFFLIGDNPTGPVLALAEGFATGASVHEATGWPCLVTFDAGNMVKVAPIARRMASPGAIIAVCGDNDVSNTGQEAARQAARLAGGRAVVLLPPTEGHDWNDEARHLGREAVAAMLANGVEVACA